MYFKYISMLYVVWSESKMFDIRYLYLLASVSKICICLEMYLIYKFIFTVIVPKCGIWGFCEHEMQKYSTASQCSAQYLLFFWLVCVLFSPLWLVWMDLIAVIITMPDLAFHKYRFKSEQMLMSGA